MAISIVSTDPFRDYMSEDELSNTEQWINGVPPNYDVINKLFTEERTKAWGIGTLEEKVQRLVKTWEMELVHKARPTDYKTVDSDKLVVGVNGKKYFTLKGVREIGGGYNMFLQTSLPPSLRLYDPEKQSYESSQSAFKTTFPGGFAIEILQVYSGPPLIAYKFRHWAYMEGPFQGHAPTGDKVEFFGMSTFELDGDTFSSKIVKVEFYFDRGELLSGLIKGKPTDGSTGTAPSGCPFMSR